MTNAIPSVFYKATFIVCEHKNYFSHVLIQNYLLWIFELYLIVSVKERTKWVMT